MKKEKSPKAKFIEEVFEDVRINRVTFSVETWTKHHNVKGGRSEYSEDEVNNIYEEIITLKQSLSVYKNVLLADFVYSMIKMRSTLSMLSDYQYGIAMREIRFLKRTKSVLVFSETTEKAILQGFSEIQKFIAKTQKKYNL